MEVVGDVQLIASGFNLDYIPPALTDVELFHYGSSVFTAVGAPSDTPRMNVGLTDGTNNAFFLYSSHIAGWTGPKRLFINPTTYARLNNPAAGGGQNLSYKGLITKLGGGPTNVVSGVIPLAGAGLGVDTVIIQPPIGEGYMINAFGSDTPVGVAPAGLPNILVEIGDGTIWAVVMDGTNTKLWFADNLKLYIHNGLYLRITNLAVGAAVVGWSGQRVQAYGSGAGNIMSGIATVGAGGLSIAIQPPTTTEQWLVTGIFSDVQIGAAPAQLADVNVQNSNGNLASLMARNSDFDYWLHGFEIPVSNAQFVMVTDTGGAGANLAFSATRTRNP
jgi:hypothetical protein